MLFRSRCDPNDKDKWILDEEAAPVVKRIFDLCIDGKGPEQISRILERDQVLTTKALYASRKGKPLPKNPYGWKDQSIVGILERQVIHRIPRRFLFIRWGTKALRQEIVSTNPHTRIVHAEYVKIER